MTAPVDEIDVVTRWVTRRDRLCTRIEGDIRGGNMPPNVRRELADSAPPDLGADSTEYQLVKRIKSFVEENFLPDPPRPIKIGGDEIPGKIAEVMDISSSTSENIAGTEVAYRVEYANGLRPDPITVKTRLQDFPDDIRQMIEQVHRKTNALAKESIWNKLAPEKRLVAAGDEVSGSAHMEFSGSATLTDANARARIPNPYEEREGYQTSGVYVVATSDATRDALHKAGIDLGALLRDLRQHPDHAEFELRLVTAALTALVEMLQVGAVHLGMAQDSRNWLRRFIDNHPEATFVVQVTAGIATLAAIIAG